MAGSPTYHPIPPISPSFYAQSANSLSFDPVTNTLWAGTTAGTVVAYHGAMAVRGVQFRVGGNFGVTKVLAEHSHVRALASQDLMGSWAKGGMNKWQYKPLADLSTFSNTSTVSPVLAASTNAPEILLLNSMTGDVVRQVPSLSTAKHLQFSHSHLISGSLDGTLKVHDPRTGMRREGAAESSAMAHLGGIDGLACTGNFAFTIGFGARQARPMMDPLMRVYDLRSLRSLSSIAFPSGPAFIDVIPRRSSSVVITSAQGLVNIVDVTNPNSSPEFYQIDVSSYVTSTAISPTGVYMAFGDAEGAIHLMTAADGTLPFNGFEGHPFEWADSPAALPDIQWTDSTPLNSIGMPFYTSQLLSSWTPLFQSNSSHFPPPQKIPSQVLAVAKTNDNISYAAMPRELKGRRNMVSVGPQKHSGRFRSGKSRSGQLEPETPIYDASGEGIPRIYQHVEIEYSKYGVEDFDFGYYNKTDYSGLETHILHSYTNPILQVMHYCEPIRRLAKSHITTSCPREHCLLCELGFVVRMLEDASGTNCQGSNFCKTVGVLAQGANAFELVDYGLDSNEVNYAQKIQSFHRFLIDHLSSEGNSFPHNPLLVKNSKFTHSSHTPAAAPVTQLLGIDAKNVITCASCKAVREKENMTHVIDMTYARKGASNEPSPPSDFTSILRTSLLRQMTHKATCQTCKHFATFSSRRSIASKDLPPVLAINACVNNEENLRLWLDTRSGTFLKPQIELHGQIDGGEDPEPAIYTLRALVVQIVTKSGDNHLVSIVKVPEAEQSNDFASPWFVFNDFAVRDTSERDALSFPEEWKVPCVIYMERVDLKDRLDYSGLPFEIDASILSRDTSISINRDKKLIKHECLRYDELPKPGTLVAIDAEFVEMQQEETEFRSDGTQKVLRPKRMSLARVSVLRGDGSKEGVPFIDDHIHTSEPIVDHLTKYSGIKFGDLDPRLSPYTLTPLKLVYKKLRLLVDHGCIFIGHGLSKDFRIINIFVPPDQVIDTVDLYFLRIRQRRLSLRFLSWIVLKENIQADTHDSIEDARSALRLYKAYHRFEEQGIFDEKLEEIYREGKQCNWKAPEPTPVPAPSPGPPANVMNMGQQIPQFPLSANSLLQPSLVPGMYPMNPQAAPVPNFFNPAMYPPNWSHR
ncbi:hypothetical protein HGRIS_013567 [Hohenbuehelia grisea]|uniref:PAN2-PAN3 deadenylation complex catalytic subunit PAN2 n=1 Tax=Hohenbuehelia grisea TaxID=104357 RepID=A0ABR3IW63_9AGAR